MTAIKTPTRTSSYQPFDKLREPFDKLRVSVQGGGTVLTKSLEGYTNFWFVLAKPACPFAALRACPFCWLKYTLSLVRDYHAAKKRRLAATISLLLKP
jgi:hypothetical protein